MKMTRTEIENAYNVRIEAVEVSAGRRCGTRIDTNIILVAKETGDGIKLDTAIGLDMIDEDMINREATIASGTIIFN